MLAGLFVFLFEFQLSEDRLGFSGSRAVSYEPLATGCHILHHHQRRFEPTLNDRTIGTSVARVGADRAFTWG